LTGGSLGFVACPAEPDGWSLALEPWPPPVDDEPPDEVDCVTPADPLVGLVVPEVSVAELVSPPPPPSPLWPAPPPLLG
jgi:hypothetical protein